MSHLAAATATASNPGPMRLHPRAAGAIIAVVAMVLALVTNSGAAAAASARRVRVTLLAGSPAESLLAAHGLRPRPRLVGTLLTTMPDAIALRPDADLRRLEIPRELVASFETSTHRTSRAGRGALIGLLAGTGAGIALGAYVLETESLQWGGYGLPILFGTAGGFVGIGLGSLIGGLNKVDHWAPAALPGAESPPSPGQNRTRTRPQC